MSFFTTAQQLGKGPQSFKAKVFTGNGLSLLANFSHNIPVVNSGANQPFSFVASGTTSILRLTDDAADPGIRLRITKACGPAQGADG